MTRIRLACRLLVCLVAAPACFGADDAPKPERRMGAPEHFESHAAWMLQRMIKVNLALDESSAHAVDLVFADYYRRTGEHLPRPVLIAYPIGEGSAVSDAKSVVITAETGHRIKGKIQRNADGSPVMLVERILEVLDSDQEPFFRNVLNRWAQIKPEPVAIPIIELMRASRDPLLRLTPEQSKKVETILMTKSKAAMRAPVVDPNTSRLDSATERIRLEIFAVLTPRQRNQLEATLTFVEQDTADWYALKIGGDALYAEAVTLLAAEAKKKSSDD